MWRFLCSFLLVLVLPFAWADDLYLTSQTADPSDDCLFGDSDVGLPCLGSDLASEWTLHQGRADILPAPVPPKQTPAGPLCQSDSDLPNPLFGTALLYALRSLRW